MDKTGWTYVRDSFFTECDLIVEEGQLVDYSNERSPLEPWSWLQSHEEAIKGLKLTDKKPEILTPWQTTKKAI